ncbi:MAG TPA: Mov34/MPN/PAD-1 family protein [Burkholderiaceae bacterium]|nr:Mov34/MPN/PAD-1 family protein [Burkholderiaceae bacterium]
MRYRFDSWTFELGPGCLDVFDASRQRAWWHLETGGQLFAGIRGKLARVEVATVTGGRSSRRGRRFRPDPLQQRAEVSFHASRGLCYVGDWHTHPEDEPAPSGIDEATMLDVFRSANPPWGAMLMIIVGRARFPAGLFVGGVAAHPAPARRRAP